jgi:hypothetical protein
MPLAGDPVRETRGFVGSCGGGQVRDGKSAYLGRPSSSLSTISTFAHLENRASTDPVSDTVKCQVSFVTRVRQVVPHLGDPQSNEFSSVSAANHAEREASRARRQRPECGETGTLSTHLSP